MSEVTADGISAYFDSRDDFDLELFAYRELTLRGWFAHHGGTYTDPITSKFRQYDVRAHAFLDRICAVSLAVECKSLSPEFPLVVSRVPRPELDSYHDVIKAWRDPNSNWNRCEVLASQPNELRLYGTGEMVGKSLTQIRWDKSGGGRWIASDTETHEKWSQALASAEDLVQAAARARGTDGSDAYTLVLPILVVSDSTLWVVDYGEDGKRATPKPTDETTLFVGRECEIRADGQELTYRMSHLHICTRKGFFNLLQQMAAPGPYRERLFQFVIYGSGRRRAGQ